jgi:hypothetical protein
LLNPFLFPAVLDLEEGGFHSRPLQEKGHVNAGCKHNDGCPEMLLAIQLGGKPLPGQDQFSLGGIQHGLDSVLIELL